MFSPCVDSLKQQHVDKTSISEKRKKNCVFRFLGEQTSGAPGLGLFTNVAHVFGLCKTFLEYNCLPTNIGNPCWKIHIRLTKRCATHVLQKSPLLETSTLTQRDNEHVPEKNGHATLHERPPDAKPVTAVRFVNIA